MDGYLKMIISMILWMIVIGFAKAINLFDDIEGFSTDTFVVFCVSGIVEIVMYIAIISELMEWG